MPAYPTLFRVAPGFILTTEVLLFYRQVLFNSSRYIIPWDLRYYHFPQAFFIARQLQAGEWPLWNPWVYCGMPWYAKTDSQLFYPPSMLAIVVSNWFGGKRLWYFLELQVIAHVLMAGIFAYLLARYLGVSRSASLVTGTIYQLGCFFATQSQHVSAVSAAAWLPLAWLGIVMLASGFTWLRLAILAMALAMVILAGYPATGIPIFISCGLLALLLASFGQARWRLLGHLGLAVVWSAALAALPLLPSLELSRLSHAGQRGYWGIEGGIPPQALLTLIHPNYFGIFHLDTGSYNLPWNSTFIYLYCGLPAMVFIALGLVQRRDLRIYIYVALSVAVGVWMLGKYTLVGPLVLRALPPILRGGLYVEFAMCAFALGIAVAAGLGAHHVMRSIPLSLRAAIVAVVAADLILASSGRLFNICDRRGEPGLGYDHFDASREVPQQMRSLTGEVTPPWRIDLMDGSTQWNNGAMLFEVPTSTGDDPFAPLRVLKVRDLFAEQAYWLRANQVKQLDSPLLDFLNVRYILSLQDIDPDLVRRAAFRRVDTLPGQVLYENPEAMPRFFLVRNVLPARDGAEACERMKTADLRREAVVELPETGWNFGPGGTVRPLRYSVNEVLLETETPAGAYLVTSETHYPGWRAWVDGVERSLYMTNGAFRGLPVPPGRHEVRMSFQPALLWKSAAVAGLAWILLCVAVTFSRISRAPLR